MTSQLRRCLAGLPPVEIIYDGEPLQSVLSNKYLGVTLDNQLNYNSHVNKIISSVSGKLKQFQRMRNFLNVKAAVLVYKSMLLPLLEYGNIFLSATSKENRRKLQTLQNKGLRCALNKGIKTSSDELHEEVGLLKLSSRRGLHLLNSMFDWSWDPLYAKAPPGLAGSNIKTRSQEKRLLKLKKPSTEKYRKSLSYSGQKELDASHVTQSSSKAGF